MKKRYFWLYYENELGVFVDCFRSEMDRRNYLEELKESGVLSASEITALHPEVRRIHRRMAAGEQIKFPCEVE